MRLRPARADGFTLIELLIALLILSILALMSYRGLGAVLDARAHVALETEKWRKVSAFFSRFERDLHLAAPRASRTAAGEIPGWIGRYPPSPDPQLEFSRFGTIDGPDAARRVGYRLNDNQEVELLLWPALDTGPGVEPVRYVVLRGVTKLDLQYLTPESIWVDAWPASRLSPATPRGVRMHLVLASKEELVRIFAVKL